MGKTARRQGEGSLVLLLIKQGGMNMENGKLVPARMLERKNRFVALVEVDGRENLAHIPNSGRMKELLFPGAQVVLREAGGKGRKTPYELLFAFQNGKPVAIDSQLPNRLMAEAIKRGEIQELAGYEKVQREASWGHSRFDLLLKNGEKPDCLVEIKSVNLVKGETAFFPDAPTIRGRRHLEDLGRAAQEGFRTAAFFLVMREDAHMVCPNDSLDPEFGQALRWAVEQGMEVMARSCRLRGFQVQVGDPLPVCL